MNFRWLRRRERELDEEIRSHLEMASQDRAERGAQQQQARTAARREFGNVELVKETMRDNWAWQWLNRLWTDVRFAARTLTKSPGFCAVAVLTLGLGIGANTAIFSVVQAVLLSPLPYKDSSRIVEVYSRNEYFKGLFLGISLGDAAEVKKDVHALTELTIYSENNKNLAGEGEPQRVALALVDRDFFAFLGVTPQLGRLFIEQDSHPGSENVAVLSDVLWRTQFGSGKEVLGKTLRLDGKSYTIVGVAGAGFQFPASDTLLWIPLAPTLAETLDHDQHIYQALSRLPHGATLEQANNELHAVSARIEKENKNGFVGWVMSTVNLQENLVEEARLALLILFGAVVLLLLIACANVANLLLTRGWQRHKEMALRTALGASRWRIAQLLLTESMLLSAAGGALGLALAVWGVEAFKKLAPEGIPRIEELHANWEMTFFALLCTVFTGIVFGVLPAMQAARWDPNVALKETGTSGIPARQRLRDAFAILEIAMALPLLIGAGLLVKGFFALTHSPLGFRTDHFLVMNIDLQQTKYPSPNKKYLYVEQLLEKVQSVPGVEHAAVSTYYPLSGNVSLSAGYRIEGDPESKEVIGNVETDSVTPNYFQTMGIPILRGRAFSEQDSQNSPHVVIISETLARQSWNGRDPLSTRISGIGAQKGSKLQIVGIAQDIRDVEPGESPRPKTYYPMAQAPNSSLSLLLRTKSDPASLAPALRQQIWSLDKDQPVTAIQTMDTVLSRTVAEPRFRALLLGMFAALGALLASIGIYGVVSYSVTLRTREIGVRMAMGAQKKNILGLVTGHGLRIAGFGIALGLAGALGLTRFLEDLLYGVSSRDPWVFVAVALLLAGVALAACYIPARRATKVDPMVALRYE